jgi:hypothetical protein
MNGLPAMFGKVLEAFYWPEDASSYTNRPND